MMVEGRGKELRRKSSLEWVVFLLKPISFDMKGSVGKILFEQLSLADDR